MNQPITLTEKLGAMAIIDSMSRQRRLVEEHLNLGERRKEVIKQVTDYYASVGQQVAPELIEQGVQEYFSKRLTFREPNLTRLQTFLIRLYITRVRWLPIVFKGFAVLAMMTAITLGTMYAYRLYNEKAVRSLFREVVGEQTRIREAFETRSKILSELTTSHIPSPIANIIDQLQQNVFAASPNLSKQLPYPTQLQVSDKEKLTELLGQLGQYKDQLKEVDHKIAQIKELLPAYSEYVRLTTSKGFKAFEQKYPILREGFLNTESLLVHAGIENGLGQVLKSMGALKTLYGNVPAIENVLSEQERILNAFTVMNLLEAQKAQIQTFVTALENSTQLLAIEPAHQQLQELNNLLYFAKTSLRFRIVDRAGISSGIERSYNPTGGKSWYLVVEAVDPSGNPVAIPVQSAETGEHQNAKLFGVRVTHAEYEVVKRDKKSDGRIDKKEMGIKPANSLSMEFDPKRVTGTPDMITKW